MLSLESGELYSHPNFYSFKKYLLSTICAMHFAKLHGEGNWWWRKLSWEIQSEGGYSNLYTLIVTWEVTGAIFQVEQRPVH